jgi:hypothetical protein
LIKILKPKKNLGKKKKNLRKTGHNQQGGVSHYMALPITLKSILRQKKKNYGNSKISPCKNMIFKKSSKKETKILQDIRTL